MRQPITFSVLALAVVGLASPGVAADDTEDAALDAAAKVATTWLDHSERGAIDQAFALTTVPFVFGGRNEPGGKASVRVLKTEKEARGLLAKFAKSRPEEKRLEVRSRRPVTAKQATELGLAEALPRGGILIELGLAEDPLNDTFEVYLDPDGKKVVAALEVER